MISVDPDVNPIVLELEIAPDGSPDDPLVVVPIDAWADEPEDRIERAAAAIAESSRIAIGLLRRPPTPKLEPLLRAATTTLSDTQAQHVATVECPDLYDALARVDQAVRNNPCAGIALARLLRQCSKSDTVSGLAVEAAVYSMLLSGKEFARWLRGRGPSRPVLWPDRPLVRVHRSGDLLSLVLDHPERRNSLSWRLREQLLEALRVADMDPTVGQVHIRGAGPVFCSGGDLDEFGNATDLVAAYLVRLERAPWRIIDRHHEHLSVHVHGSCIGAGIEMAAFAGRLDAAEDAVFRLPEIAMGLIPGAGGTVSIPRRIGQWRAAWMMLTGTEIDAATALEWGLVDAIVPNSEAL